MDVISLALYKPYEVLPDFAKPSYHFLLTSMVQPFWTAYLEVPVFVSFCSYKKLPQVSWFKTTQIYYLTVLEVRSFK